MGRTVPETQQATIDFFSARVADWAKAPAAIGLSAATVAAVSARLAEARAALAAAQAARVAAMAATLVLRQAMDELRRVGGDAVKTIRVYAESTGDTQVFVDAQIPPVSPPTPTAPPAAPTRLAATILAPFGVGLSWRGRTGGGVMFGVWRRIGGAGDFTLIDITRARRYEDTTLPAGTGRVDYYIAAHRGAFRANSAAIAVSIAGGGGQAVRMAS
jgi:hypothetical protein